MAQQCSRSSACVKHQTQHMMHRWPEHCRLGSGTGQGSRSTWCWALVVELGEIWGVGVDAIVPQFPGKAKSGFELSCRAAAAMGSQQEDTSALEPGEQQRCVEPSLHHGGCASTASISQTTHTEFLNTHSTDESDTKHAT